MKKILKWIFAALVAAFVVAQLFNPPRTNPPVVNDLMAEDPPPPEIAARLRTSCYDCHSYETKWPWYSHVAPVSWLIASDVSRGRRNMNFSDWPTNDPVRVAKRLEDMSEEIGYDEMPPKKYTLIHADARLTDGQRQQLEDWLDGEAGRLKASVTNP